MRIIKATVGAALVAGLLSAGSVALAASHPAGGPVQVFVTQGQGAAGTIILTGAIGDHGKTLSVDKNGKTNANGDFQKVTLKNGGFWVDTTTLDAKLNKLNPQPNPVTCSVAASATGPVTLSKGTGLYAGISGKIKITVTFAEVGPKLANGKCNPSMNAKPVAQYQSITGTGNVSFS